MKSLDDSCDDSKSIYEENLIKMGFVIKNLQNLRAEKHLKQTGLTN